MSRRLQIVDSLLDLDADSREADTIRLRRAHLARYAKMAMAGALAICFVAGVRVAIEAVMDDVEGVATTATVEAPTGADTSVRPQPTPAAEVVPSATERLKLVAVAKRSRR